MQNTPFNGAGRRPAPHPFLAILPSPKAIHIHTYSSALYRMRICYVLWEYVNMKESRSTCSGCVGGPGRLPPPPSLRCRSRGGGGGGSWRAGSCLGSWAGKGGSLPCELGGSHSRVYMANLYGRFIRQIYMATLYGGFVWRVKWAHLFKDWRQENIAKQMK